MTLGNAGRELAKAASNGVMAATAQGREKTRLVSPGDLASDCSYDLEMLTGPVFDGRGRAVLVITLPGFDRELTGAEIEQWSDMLARACRQITAGGGGRSPARLTA